MSTDEYCCERMRLDLEQVCGLHENRAACPDALIGKIGGDFGLLIHDGGTSMIAIDYCPWCGTHLSETD